MRKRMAMLLVLCMVSGIVYPVGVNETYAAEVQGTEIISENVSSVNENLETASAEADENGFVIEDGVLTDYTGAGGDIVIPDSVTNIGSYVFSDCGSLTSVEIPDSVTSIGDGAFSLCNELTSIKIPSSVESVGVAAFAHCGNLSSVGLSGGLISIGSSAFYNCSSLTNIEIPISVTSIGVSAFESCTNLTIQMSYTGSNVSMGDNAFSDCKGLQVKVLDGVTSIENGAFSGCSSLTSIEIPSSVASIGNGAFNGCSSLTSIEIPNSVMSIGNGAFSGCSSIISIEIPSSVASIGNGAFSGCSSLTSIEIPSSVTSIDGLFSGCTSLKNVVIPDSVKYIGQSAFENCSSLTSIEIPTTVTSIGYYAFQNCSSLTSIDLPDGVMQIGGSAFSGCRNLKNIILPTSMSDWFTFSIGEKAFYECSSLTAIKLPKGTSNIGNEAFYGCSSLTNIEIPDGAMSMGGYRTFSIGEKAFYECSSLADIKLPKGTASIANATFYGCSSLTDIEIPDGVTGIGANAFRNCSNLKKVSIPDSVTSIGGYAFDGCSTGFCMYCNAGSYAETYAAENEINSIVKKNQIITASDMKKTVGDKPFSIGAVMDGGGALTYESSDEAVVSVSKDGVATIHGMGKATITITASGSAEWKEEQKTIDILVYSEDGFCIGSGYYMDYDSEELVKREGVLYAYRGDAEEVTIPDNVYIIEDGVFSGCDTVTSINIHKDVDIISAAAFDNCRNLKAINVEEVDEDYEEDVTYSSIDGVLCSSTSCIRCPEGKEGSVEIPRRTKQILNGAFSGCSKLTGVTILGKNTRIYDDAFVGCSEDFYIDCLKGSYAETYAIQNGINYVSRKQQQQDFVYESDITVVIGDEPYTLDVDSEEVAGELTYASSNETIVKVSADGVLTFVGVGTAQITITASETDEFYERQEVINITVNNRQNEGQTPGGDQNPNEGQTSGGNQNPNEGQTSGGDQNPNEGQTSGGDQNPNEGQTSGGDQNLNEGQTSGGDQNPNEEPDSTQELEKEEQTISAKNFKKTYGAKTFSIGAVTDGGGALTYSVENKKIATVDKKGKVTIKGCGVTKIVINAAENEDYNAASKTITLTVVPKKATLTSVKSTKTKTITVKWKKDTKASGYIIEYSTDKKFKKNVGKVTVSKNKTTSKKISKLKAGKKYYVRVCAYTVSKGNKIKGAYTKAKMVKVKK